MNFFTSSLKTNIKKKLKTFSELKSLYGIDAIYRTGESMYFSEKSKKLNLEGVPKSRPTLKLSEKWIENTKKDEDIYEPIWYATTLQDSMVYCNRNYNQIPKPCESYKYIPYDKSLVKEKKLLFLDLTGKKISTFNDDSTGEKTDIYTLDETLIQQIYDAILKKWDNDIFETDENGKKEKYLCVDNPCNNLFTINEILDAYGYYGGYRKSEHYIDKFFTIELFYLIKEMGIEEELNCIFMGYFESNIIGGHIENNTITYEEGVMAAEFAMPYYCAINKNYMYFDGIEAIDKVIVSKKRKLIGGRKNRKSRKSRKSRKVGIHMSRKPFKRPRHFISRRQRRT